ncbi:MFS transporter [Mucilaginibacter paludis]|uniref:Major facilitator superfamily MFS_1 n=1 Tax=Mucilaginibacter paludis DSM 18603 TaxID=714943 RepID=H1YHK0_9SPHI|nr:MFS transporter [Mucilaginibacter paludis]EHQ26423.1 major facilitator superfamily MFS_1 [Mucilaginibacter paludis DSM 18603]
MNYRKTSIRTSVSMMFFTSALCFSSWTCRISFLQERLSLNDGQFGFLLFSLPLGVFFSLPLSNLLAKKIGSRKLLLVGLSLMSVILTALSFIHNVYLFSTCLLAFGFANNATNLAANIQAIETERVYQKPIIGSFHGIWSVAALIGSVIGSLSMSLQIPIQFQYVTISVISIMLILVFNKFLHVHDLKTENNSKTFNLKVFNKYVILLGLIALCAMVGEGSMYDWSEIYLKRTFGSNHFQSSLGYSLFMLSMTLGRFGSDKAVRFFGLNSSLILGGSIMAVGFLIAISSPSFAFVLISYCLIGSGVSLIIPVVYGIIAKIGNTDISQYITVVSSVSFFGLLFAPPVIGILAQSFSIKIAFILLLLISLLSIVLSQYFMSLLIRKDRSLLINSRET